MKFKYTQFSLDPHSEFFGGRILKPIIPVGITIGDEPFEYSALIDSGADFCIFDAGIAEALNLNLTSGTKIGFGGIQEAGTGEAFLHEILLLIGGWKYTTTVAFSRDVGKRSFGILGQKGFFDLFVVKFDLMKEEIELTPRKNK